VSKSFTQAEYRIVAYLVAKTTWMHEFYDFGFAISATTKVFCDNISGAYLT